jgi:ribosomal protein L11 methyltransferase
VNRSSKTWYAVDVTTLDEAADAIEYGLMEAGALGTETGGCGENTVVAGYFPECPSIPAIRNMLLDSLRIHEVDSATFLDLKLREVPDRDWLAEWKKSWQPVEVGRFIVAPPWFESVSGAVAIGPDHQSKDYHSLVDPPGTDIILIRINPGMAFGTGTHETTRLCLKAIDKHFRGGSFLDVGTGTGILAIAAAKMARPPDDEGVPATIEAYDIDAEAIAIARENAALNNVAEDIVFRLGSVDETTASADFVCANLTAPVIVELLPSLIGVTCGRLVLSGILDSQEEMVRARLAELSVTNCEVAQDGEWIALVV